MAGVSGTFDVEFESEGWPASADVEKAQEYLNAALDELGKTADEIPTFELLCYESQGSIDVLAAVQDMLKKNLGVETTINSQTIQVMVSNAMSGDYDFWYGGNALEIPDALTSFLSGYTSAMQSALRGYSNEEYDKLYPEYGFAKHKGYGSKQHTDAIHEYGPCPIHRRTFIHKFI